MLGGNYGVCSRDTGLGNRCDGDDEPTTKPTQQVTSDDPAEADVKALALGLRKDHQLAEVVGVWKLLDEPIRQAIMALVRTKPGG